MKSPSTQSDELPSITRFMFDALLTLIVESDAPAGVALACAALA